MDKKILNTGIAALGAGAIIFGVYMTNQNSKNIQKFKDSEIEKINAEKSYLSKENFLNSNINDYKNKLNDSNSKVSALTTQNDELETKIKYVTNSDAKQYKELSGKYDSSLKKADSLNTVIIEFVRTKDSLEAVVYGLQANAELAQKDYEGKLSEYQKTNDEKDAVILDQKKLLNTYAIFRRPLKQKNIDRMYIPLEEFTPLPYDRDNVKKLRELQELYKSKQ